MVADGWRERAAAICRRWQEQGSIMMPDGRERPLQQMTGASLVAGMPYTDATLWLAEPEEYWDVIFTDATFTIPDWFERSPELDTVSRLLAVDISDPRRKKVLSPVAVPA